MSDTKVTLEIIRHKDASALLAFETKNRHWFEHQIGGRDEKFYSIDGVKDHIAYFLLEHKLRKMFPYLIFSHQGHLLGRINITNIDSVTNSAEVGYRVGENYTGQGVAKAALSQVVKQMKKYGLSKLIAYASVDNPASQSVLMNNGFKAMETVYRYAKVKGKDIDCVRFEYRF